ncbi:site-specific integrase [Streptomycetaceae bacterium NBC_01309]
MAWIVTRRNRHGEVTSYQVKWRTGGGRKGDPQSERFDDEIAAEIFKKAVDDNGNNWPPGWVKGLGYIDQAAATEDELRYRFDNYARESVKNRTGVEDRYKDAIRKELETYILPTFGNCDVRSTEHFSKATVSAWVNTMAKTKVWRGSQHKLMSPKTLKNLHGLLSSILKEAVQEEPPLRARNPCDLTRLPRVDDDGADDDDEDMTFLLPEEVEAVASEFTQPQGKRLVRDLYSTGARWGEITALGKRHVFRDVSDGKPKVRIARAWKRQEGGGYYLGKPKSKASRRRIRIPETTWQGYVDAGLSSLSPNDLIYHNGKGGRLPYSTFYDWWVAAVARAHEAGTLPSEKHPTPHDLRHSHVAALISAGHSLTYVQRRLGHESITTTSDQYGHLLPEADDAAMETIEKALRSGEDPDDLVLPESDDARKVFVLRLRGQSEQGFWDLDTAEAVAEQWRLDGGTAVAVEAWSMDWWVRNVPGGLKKVHARPPERAEIWQVGPAVYRADGTEQLVRQGDHVPRSMWLWEWEPQFTDQPVVRRAEHRPNGTTEASAWGRDREAVVVGYSEAKASALQKCGDNPELDSWTRDAV